MFTIKVFEMCGFENLVCALGDIKEMEMLLKEAIRDAMDLDQEHYISVLYIDTLDRLDNSWNYQISVGGSRYMALIERADVL